MCETENRYFTTIFEPDALEHRTWAKPGSPGATTTAPTA
jgi:hypothetical protein